MNRISKSIWSITVALLLPLLLPVTAITQRAAAVSAEQRKIFNYGISYFNTCVTDGSTSSGDINSAIANANDNAEAIFNALTSTNFSTNGDKPLNAVQAAAILGNIQAESNFDPSAVNNGVKSAKKPTGIVQWTGGRLDNLIKSADGKDYLTLEVQIPFMIQELQKISNLDEFWSSKDPSDLGQATYAIVRNYEIAIVNGGGSLWWKDGQTTASSRLQSWAKRWEYAQAQYNRYKDKTPSVNSTPTTIDGQIIWTGDSRTNGMRSAVNNGDNTWVAEDSSGYHWFVNTAAPQVTSQLQDGGTIVFNFGVNDLDAADSYATKLIELASGDWAKAKQIIVMSVNPIDEAKYKKASPSGAATNDLIESFNQTIKNSLAGNSKLTYVDTYSKIKDNLATSNDGLHYTAEMYKQIYNLIRNGDANSNGAETTACSDTTSGQATAHAGSNVVVYDQCDQRWGNKPFGSSTVCAAGCGPSALAMIITALTGSSVTPDQVALTGAADYTQDGSRHSLPGDVADSYGIRVEPVDSDVQAINKVLDNSGMVWLCGKGSAPFTEIGHCIGIRARTGSGKWLVFNSSSGQDPQAEYDPAAVMVNVGGTDYSAVYKK